MTSFLIIGTYSACQAFSDDLIEREEIYPYNITVFEEIVKIDEARRLRTELSSQQSAKRLFVVKNGMTIEAQNSLLKILEEVQESVYFIFFSKSYDDYLPTIRSRCMVRALGGDEICDITLVKLIKSLSYNEIDVLADKCGKDIKRLLPALREVLLSDNLSKDNRKKYYEYCKRLMFFQKLAEINNVNEKILLEKVFLG